MKKIHLITILLFFCFNTYAQVNKSYYDTTAFDKVKLFIIDTNKCSMSKYFVDKDYNVSKCFLFYKELNKKELSKILKILNRKSTYGKSTYSCTKEVGLLFIKKGLNVSQISFSFECDNVSSDKPIYWHELKKINAGTEGNYLYPSFSKKGKKKLLKLIKKCSSTSLPKSWEKFSS